MKVERISNEEQLRRWVDGESVHRDDPNIHGGECCPDFSCCKPELLADPVIRRAFAEASQSERHKFLGTFLQALLALEFGDKKIHVAGREEPS